MNQSNSHQLLITNGEQGKHIRIEHWANCPAVSMVLPAWFEHLGESFSQRNSVEKGLALPLKMYK